MRFASPIYLWLLTALPLLTLLMAWAEWRRRAMMRRIGETRLVKALIPDASATKRWTKFCVAMLAIAATTLMLARPQLGTKVSNEQRHGIEAIICLDISNSMLAQDVQPSRLQKSKMLIENLVDHFTSDKIGLIVFAGNAFVQLPITSDYVSAKMFLQAIDPSLIEEQGTDIAAAIRLASQSFTQQKNIGKAIIVITDGEDHEGGADEAAKAAKAAGYQVYILGIGSTAGAPIPQPQGGYMTDNSGQTVMTALSEQMCHTIAAAGGGTYIHVDNTAAAQERLNSSLAKMQKNDIQTVVYSDYDEQYQVLGVIALLCLVIEVLLSETASTLLRRLAPRARRAAAVALLITVSLAATAQERPQIRAGNRTFRTGSQEAPKQAEIHYRKALAAAQGSPEALYNLGCALFAQQRDSLAYQTLQQAATVQTSKQRRAQAYHNMGVIMQRQQQYAQAIECYKKALRLTPHAGDTRYNLVLCQRLKKDQPPQQNKGGGNNNKDNKDKNKNKDKQQQQPKPDQQDKPKDDKQMSRDNAEQLLNAAEQSEKQAQQRIKKAMRQPQRSPRQQNW